jgi:hypothetical protein
MSTRLIGATFQGTTLDTNFWTATPTSSGTVAQANGEITLATGVSSNSAELVQSVRSARYVAANTNVYRAQVRLPAVTTATGTNSCKWGAFDANNGFFFEAYQANAVSTPVLKLYCRKTASDANVIASGSFNGEVGATLGLDNNVHTYEIYWTNKSAYFLVDDNLIHTFTGATATLSDTLTLSVSQSITNAGGNTANNTLVVRVASISRLGQLQTQPISGYQSGNTAGRVFKYGAGNVHRVILSGVANNTVITLYDNTAATGTVWWASGTMGAQNQPMSLDFAGAPFFTGLTMVSTGASNVAIIYE